jgi:hypothetical protein
VRAVFQVHDVLLDVGRRLEGELALALHVALAPLLFPMLTDRRVRASHPFKVLSTQGAEGAVVVLLALRAVLVRAHALASVVVLAPVVASIRARGLPTVLIDGSILGVGLLRLRELQQGGLDGVELGGEHFCLCAVALICFRGRVGSSSLESDSGSRLRSCCVFSFMRVVVVAVTILVLCGLSWSARLEE